MNNAREMQKQAAKSAKDAGKNKGKSETRELLQEKKAERRVLMWNKQFSFQREGCDCDTHTPSLKKYYLPLLVDPILKSHPPPLFFFPRSRNKALNEDFHRNFESLSF